VQTLVPIAANGGKDPEVIDAAACTFLHEGREPDFRCALHRWLLSGTNRHFAAPTPTSAISELKWLSVWRIRSDVSRNPKFVAVGSSLHRSLKQRTTCPLLIGTRLGVGLKPYCKRSNILPRNSSNSTHMTIDLLSLS